jgi:hypothetical protein
LKPKDSVADTNFKHLDTKDPTSVTLSGNAVKYLQGPTEVRNLIRHSGVLKKKSIANDLSHFSPEVTALDGSILEGKVKAENVVTTRHKTEYN